MRTRTLHLYDVYLIDVVRHVVVLRLPALASLPLACDAIMGLINATNRLWWADHTHAACRGTAGMLK